MNSLARDTDKAEVIRRLRALGPDSAPRWGRMSAHQVVCHMSDAFRMAVGQKAVSPASGLLQRTLLKWTALYIPVPWPPGILTRPEIDQECGGTKPRDFPADVATLEQLVDLVTSRDQSCAWPAHPIFGRMSRSDWLRWGYLHMDHHLRQFGA